MLSCKLKIFRSGENWTQRLEFQFVQWLKIHSTFFINKKPLRLVIIKILLNAFYIPIILNQWGFAVNNLRGLCSFATALTATAALGPWTSAVPWSRSWTATTVISTVTGPWPVTPSVSAPEMGILKDTPLMISKQNRKKCLEFWTFTCS